MKLHHATIGLLFLFLFVSAQTNRPIITPAGGYFSSSRLIILESGVQDSAISIYYTLDGSNPLLSKTRNHYTKPFRISKSLTVTAISVSAKGLKSELSQADFKKITRLEAPSIQRLTNSNSYAIFSEQKLQKEGIELYYTLDGRDPSVFGYRYKGEIFSKHGMHIKAVALHREREYLNSDVVSLVIDTVTEIKNSKNAVEDLIFNRKQISVKDTSSLKIDWKNGESAGEFLVLFSHADKDINFIYTLDGSDPVPGSTMWNGKPFSVKSPAHIKVRTYEMGMKLGGIMEKVFNPPQLPEPISDISSGTPFSGELTVRLSVPGALFDNIEILYTLNGKDPLKEGILYTGPLVLNENTVIRAIAQGAGFSTSNEGRFEYFYMIEITSAVFIDNNKDGFVESARLTLSSPANSKPPQMKFTDPANGHEVILNSEDMKFEENHDVLQIVFPQSLKCSPDFSPGHYGAILVPGEFSTTPFLVYGEKTREALESEKSLNIQVVNNPFIPEKSILSEHLQEIADFSAISGTAISVKTRKPSFGYATIFDALGNVILSKREMVEDDGGTLYLFWDGKDNFGKIVNCGNYLVIISCEEKVNGVSSQGRAFVSVKCP